MHRCTHQLHNHSCNSSKKQEGATIIVVQTTKYNICTKSSYPMEGYHFVSNGDGDLLGGNTPSKINRKSDTSQLFSYKTSETGWLLPLTFFLSFIILLCLHNLLSNKMGWWAEENITLVSPRCSNNTFFVFTMFFFGKLLNQFTLSWGQISVAKYVFCKGIVYHLKN